MHDFDNIHARKGLRAIVFALASLGLMACPMDDDGTGDTGSNSGATTVSPGTSTGESASEATTTGESASEATTGSESGSESGSETGAATYSLSGTVRRSADIGPGNDGVGTLFVAAFAECGLGQSLLAFAVVPAADLSTEEARIPFSLTGLPAGPVQVVVFLDDNGDADPMAPQPHDGDLVYGFDACDGEADCVPLQIADADLVDVALDLNLLEVDDCP